MAEDSIAAEHEVKFVQSFIMPARRQHYLSKLSSPKHRSKFLDRLNHQLLDDIDDQYVSSVTRGWPKEVKECYLLADEAKFDKKIISAKEAENVLSSAYFGLIISFVPGKLACYKGESPSDVIWLEHK